MIRAALKSLLGRKVRLLMSTFAIVLGVAFVAGSLIFSDTLERSFTAIFASSVGDVVVRPEGGTTAEGFPTNRTVPASLVDRLAEVPGAARVDGNVGAVGVYVVGKDDKVVGGFGPPAFGGNWNDAPAGRGLEGLTIVDGREPDGPGEVVLDARTASKAGYSIGEKVRIVTASDQAVLQPELVGLADFAEGGSTNGATLSLFDTRTAQDLFLDGRNAFHDLWVTAAPGTSQEELRDRVAEELPDDVEAVTGDEAADEAATALVEAISFLTTFLLIFAGISLVVGAYLIVNTFSILVAQRSRELALLRALGASKRQVSASVLLEAFVLGLIGASLGLGLGVVLAMGIRELFSNFGLDLSGQSLIFQTRTVVAAYVVGVAVTMAAAWLPARRTGRIAPVQALRDDVAMPEASVKRRLAAGVGLLVAGGVALGAGLFGDVPRAGWFVGGGVLGILLGVSVAAPVITRPFLAAARWLYAAVFGSIGNLAGQNSLRNPRRTTATASALMIGLALACTMAIVGDSAKASVDKSVEENFVGDYIVSNVFGQPFSPSIGREMAEVEGVDQVVRQRFAFATYEDDDEPMAAIAPGTSDELGLVAAEGSFDRLADDTMLLEEGWAEGQGLAVGDTMTWELPTGDKTFEVVGTYEQNPVVFFPVLTTIDALEDAGFPRADNTLVIMTGGEQVGLQNRLAEVVADNPVVTVKNQNEFAEEQRGPIDQLVLMIFALLGLALVIAVLGIVNTLALSIIERTREVGLLRAIGVSRAQLRWMVTLESVVISLLGALLGVVMGIGFGVAMMYAIRDQGLEVISVPWDQLGVFLGVSLVIGVLAAVLPSRRAARLDVLRAIATE
ncbi:ABC transporter permease [Nocardioides sp. GCM10027113]|uniref:ABC transporter permease n=1 Tax=unclassified Nocardioides TaxID=2615069 RepID=UPI003608B57D